MNRSISTLLVSLVLAVAAIGCIGGINPPVLPTRVRTATPAPPTATPLPTTTPVITTSFKDALENAKQAQVYRMEMDLRASGQLSGLGSGVTSGEEIALFTLEGAVNGDDSDLKLGGAVAELLTAFLGVDAAGGVRILTVGDQGYIETQLPGDAEPRWYILPAGDKDSQTPLDPTDLIESFEEANLDPSAFDKVATETFDDILCDVYAADKDAVLQAFMTVGVSQDTDLDPSQVEQAEMRFYICADGFLHQMTMHLVAHDKAEPTEKDTFRVRMHIFDIDGDIAIEAPTGALPLQIPGFDSTPTPQN